MIIFISPSKTFKNTLILPKSEPLFTSKTKTLHDKLSLFTLNELKTGFRISDSLALQTFNYIHDNNNYKKAAGALYDGALYKKLNFESITNSTHKLYILDAYYGILRTYDAISPYRLDFVQSLITNLYEFWYNDINHYLRNNYQNELLISLASKEFEKMLDKDLNYYVIDFKLTDKKISNVLLKQMRGAFANTILTNNSLKTIIDLKKIEVDGFSFNEKQSTSKLLIFTR